MIFEKEIGSHCLSDLLKSLLYLEDLIMVEVNSKRLDIEYVESDWEN